MPVMPVCLLDPVWQQFEALLPVHPPVAPSHPLGCHRRRVPDRVVFDHVVAALVHGSGYERIATPGCSDRTIRRRVHAWAEAGVAEDLHGLALQQYDRMIGIDLDDVVVDGCITKAPCGGEKAGRSPVDRGKQGLKRSTLADADGVPLHLVAAGANRHDAPLLEPTLAGLETFGPLPAGITAHLDRGYDSNVTRTLLASLALTGEIARKGGSGSLAGGDAMGRRAHPVLDERLRQGASLHGADRADGRLLSLPGSHVCGRSLPHPRGAQPVSLA